MKDKLHTYCFRKCVLPHNLHFYHLTTLFIRILSRKTYFYFSMHLGNHLWQFQIIFIRCFMKMRKILSLTYIMNLYNMLNHILDCALFVQCIIVLNSILFKSYLYFVRKVCIGFDIKITPTCLINCICEIYPSNCVWGFACYIF